MKTISFFLFALFASCATKKEIISQENSTIYYQKWIAGVQGGGSGINIHINFKTPLEENITLEKVQILNYETSEINKTNNNQYVCAVRTEFNTKILDENPENEYGNQPPIINKRDALDEGVVKLYFKKNGKTVTQTFNNVKEKELLAYPSAKPRN